MKNKNEKQKWKTKMKNKNEKKMGKKMENFKTLKKFRYEKHQNRSLINYIKKYRNEDTK